MASNDMSMSLTDRICQIEAKLGMLEQENLYLRTWKVEADRQLAKFSKLPSDELQDGCNQENSDLSSIKAELRADFCLELSEMLTENIKLREQNAKSSQTVENLTFENNMLKAMLEDNESKLNALRLGSAATTSSPPITSPQTTSSSTSLASATASSISTPLTTTSQSSSPPSASVSSTTSTQQLQQNNSIQEIFDYCNRHNPEGWKLNGKEYGFEMFVGGHNPAWPTSSGQSKWRVTDYNMVLFGEILRKLTYLFDGSRGIMVAPNAGVYWLSYWLEVRQRGSGSLNWYICSDMTPGEMSHGGPLNKKESVDKGEVTICIMMTTDQEHQTYHSPMFRCWFPSGARCWVEVERTSGDAEVSQCRFYGGW